ncbi:PREDICTED: atrophin-1-like [Rhagoletis zephyria]|uniref:atrophin-1-like n=1 Tax=Rhagoletis zephyria TaxID=28612 RepID=UPI0008113232|nr:PREDICTED: atrophin-1-like [Rhagoletis zephyria]
MYVLNKNEQNHTPPQSYNTTMPLMCHKHKHHQQQQQQQQQYAPTAPHNAPNRPLLSTGSVSSSDSGHGSYAQQHDTSSSVYTAADCRLLQQISNTAARNLSGGSNSSTSSGASQCSNSSTPTTPATTPIPPPPPYHMLRSATHNAVSNLYHANATGAAPLPPPPYVRLHCAENMVAPLMHSAHTRHSAMHGGPPNFVDGNNKCPMCPTMSPPSTMNQ